MKFIRAVSFFGINGKLRNRIMLSFYGVDFSAPETTYRIQMKSAIRRLHKKKSEWYSNRKNNYLIFVLMFIYLINRFLLTGNIEDSTAYFISVFLLVGMLATVISIYRNKFNSLKLSAFIDNLVRREYLMLPNNNAKRDRIAKRIGGKSW